MKAQLSLRELQPQMFPQIKAAPPNFQLNFEGKKGAADGVHELIQ